MEWKGNEGKHEYKMKSTQKSGGNQQTVRRSVGVGFFFNIERQRIDSPLLCLSRPIIFIFFFWPLNQWLPTGLGFSFSHMPRLLCKY